MNYINTVEFANHLSESINDDYRNVGDIDFLIEELNKKKKSIAKRIRKNSDILKMIITDTDFTSKLTKESLQEFKDAVDGIDELIESVDSCIMG